MVSLSITPGSGYYGNLGWDNVSGRDGVNASFQRTAALTP